jgi:hypothetical protein
LQLVFTVSCAFILAGVKAGMGHHNEAIKNDDMKVAALMVSRALTTMLYRTRTHPLTYTSGKLLRRRLIFST